jgi:ribosomal protein L11 methylase PrmA
MHPKARLIISGFYLTDLPDLEKGANKSGLIMQNHMHQDEWCAAVFELA